MVVPGLLLVLSAALAAYALLVSGPQLGDLMLLALVSGLASLILLLLGVRRKAKGPSEGKPTAPHHGRFNRGKASARPILVDGSNVMHWQNEVPQIATVRIVVDALEARGFHPGVVFDANVGYKIGDRYQDDAAIARMLGLTENQVLVVPKGTPADPCLLQTARDLGARVVTNDRYRDWAEAHPEVRTPGFLIRGGFRDGSLWLDDLAP